MLGAPVRIVVAQVVATPGDIARNGEERLEVVRTARRSGANMVVFPELTMSAYVLGDRWENDYLIFEIERWNEKLREASEGMVIIFGSIVCDRSRIGEDGRMRKYNAVLIAQNGVWVNNGVLVGFVPKTNLPKYRVFDDARHFYPAGKLAEEMGLSIGEFLRPFPVTINGKEYKLALTVCEDLWEDEYHDKPSKIYREHGADLMIDISCSPWTPGKWHARERMLRMRVKDSGIPILYVNAVGLENNVKNLIWIDGESSLIDKDGVFRWRGKQHKEQIHMLDLDDLGDPPSEPDRSEIREIYGATIGARRAFGANFPKFVTGVSGGIDSAVATALNVEAFGPDRVLGINMPTVHNSQTTRGLAAKLAENLGIEYRVVPIQGLFEESKRTLAQAGYPNPKGLTLENMQAHLRAHVLGRIAQEEGGVYTCNGNKTEIALNYFTMNADGSGFAAFEADLWKGKIYALGRYINQVKGREVIPEGCFEIVASAELSADQAVDEGKGDPIFFPYHDKLLEAFTEWRWDPTKVLEYLSNGADTLERKLGCPQGTIYLYFKSRKAFVDNLEWAWRQYNLEFKRAQTPPILLASRSAFGFDRRATIADAYLTDRYKKLRAAYLSKEEIT
jgi:NAD+ synthase (glutamine-hydrolysing)